MWRASIFYLQRAVHSKKWQRGMSYIDIWFNPLNAELNSICHLLALLGVHHFLHVSTIRVKSLTLKLLMSYIYVYIRVYIYICIYIYIWSTYSWCFEITHNDAPQSVGLLWMSDQLVAETSTWQHTTLTTNIHAPGGIWTHDLSRRAEIHLRLNPRGHWDRRLSYSPLSTFFSPSFFISRGFLFYTYFNRIQSVYMFTFACVLNASL